MRTSLSPFGIRLVIAMFACGIGTAASGSLALWCTLADPLAAHDDANLFLWAVDLQAWLDRGGATAVPANVRGAPYPPLLPLVAAAAFQGTGLRSPGIAEAASAVAVLPLCLSVAWMAWCTHPARRRGLAALAAAAIAPLPLWSLGHPGTFHLDLSLGALVGATACCGAATLARGGTGSAVATGVLGALSLAVKWTAGLFLWPLLLVGIWRCPGRTSVAVAVCLVLVGPWYLDAGPALWTFVEANLAGDYTGGSNPLALVSPFYPSRLVHGVVGTPLLVCFVAGLAHRGPHRTVVGCLFAGVVALTLQPYPDERYLLAGLGLLAPAVVWGASRLLGRLGLLAVLAAGLVFVWSWLPVGVPQGTLIARRDGLRAAGLRAARADLQTPVLRWKGAAPSPFRSADPLQLAARALDRAAPPGPLAVHVVDLVGRSVLERTRVELARVRGPGVQISRPPEREEALRAALSAGQTQAWSPPRALARRAWVLVNLREADLPASRKAWEHLTAEGREVVYRGGAPQGERPGVVIVWGPPVPRAPG